MQEEFKDYTIEQVVPEYVDVSWVKQAPAQIYRYDSGDKRFYYTLDEYANPTFYTSVTSFISASLPTPKQLEDWKMSMGKREADEYMMDRADYGSGLHILCAELLINAKINLDHIAYNDDLLEFLSKVGRNERFLRANLQSWKKDLLAFAQFLSDYNVVPVAIEIGLAHPDEGYAGTIDLVCEMDVEVTELGDEVFKSGPRKGHKKPVKVKKRMLCIVDIKSGKKNFYLSHEIQLAAYKRMWEVNFPDLPVQRLFNWGPKDWTGIVPSYHLKDQTESRHAQKLPHLVELARIDAETKSNTLTICHGEIDILKGVYSNVETIELSELVKRKRQEK